MKMTVSGLGMKRNLGNAFNALIDVINTGERECEGFSDVPSCVCISIDDLIEVCADLRAAVATIAYTYIESDDPDFFPEYEFEGKWITEVEE